jgi:carboxymethylenebutenolidase
MRDDPSFDRRTFVTGALAAGFALAVRPVSADTKHTGDEGLIAGDVKIPSGGGEMPAYRAMPALGGSGAFPVVVVVHEIFGVHEHIKDVCRRLAKLGYLAVAPELFARQGNAAALGSVDEIVKTIVSKVPDAQVMADLDATAAWAGKGKGNTARLGITGFCWGGRIVWLYSAHNPALKAGVAWYGKLTGQPSAMQSAHPLDLAASLKGPVLGLYGGADTGIPQETIEQMRAAIKAAKGKSEIVVYPDAPHAFFADYRPSYRADAAEDGWNRMKAWLKAKGV